MSTAQKTTEIERIAANYDDNRQAASAARIPSGLSDIILQARNRALLEDLLKVFAMPPAGASLGALRRATKKQRGRQS